MTSSLPPHPLAKWSLSNHSFNLTRKSLTSALQSTLPASNYAALTRPPLCCQTSLNGVSGPHTMCWLKASITQPLQPVQISCMPQKDWPHSWTAICQSTGLPLSVSYIISKACETYHSYLATLVLHPSLGTLIQTMQTALTLAGQLVVTATHSGAAVISWSFYK